MKFVTNYREFNEEKNAPSVRSEISDHEIVLKENILKYMRSFEDDVVCPSKVYDVIQNKVTTVPLVYYTDGEFIWDERDIYHFEKYNIHLNNEFIHKIHDKKCIFHDKIELNHAK